MKLDGAADDDRSQDQDAGRDQCPAQRPEGKPAAWIDGGGSPHDQQRRGACGPPVVRCRVDHAAIVARSVGSRRGIRGEQLQLGPIGVVEVEVGTESGYLLDS